MKTPVRLSKRNGIIRAMSQSMPGVRTGSVSGIGYGSVPGSASGIVVIPTASVLCLSAKAIATRSSAWISSNSASTSLIFLAYLASIAARRPFNSSFARSRSVEVRLHIAAARELVTSDHSHWAMSQVNKTFSGFPIVV
jgi:hypothetical protein